jgi:flagellar basal-body rod protein FlgF
MLKGIYRAASGMIPRIRQQEVTANNIANAATPGYKKDSIFLKELDAATREKMPRKSDWETPMIDQVYTDFSQGSFDATSNALDVAIEGSGFFVLENPEGGEPLYTRNGHFSVSSEGYLINDEGFRVLGDGGPLDVGNGTVSISESGEASVNEAVVGRLQVVDFADKTLLTKQGDSTFAVRDNAEPAPVTAVSLRQGYLERSNINVIKEMVGMIITLRDYEAGSRAIQMQDDSLNALFNDVGKVRL